MQSFYHVDAKDRITEIGGSWDKFAHENDGARALAQNLIGTDLFDSIAGDTTKMYIDALLRRARLTKTGFGVDYTCCTPNEHRRAHMKLSSRPDGIVRVEHFILKRQRLMPAASSSDGLHTPQWTAPLKKCLDCNRVYSNQRWISPHELPFQPGQSFFRGFCDECQPQLVSASGPSCSCSLPAALGP